LGHTVGLYGDPSSYGSGNRGPICEGVSAACGGASGGEPRIRRSPPARRRLPSVRWCAMSRRRWRCPAQSRSAGRRSAGLSVLGDGGPWCEPVVTLDDDDGGSGRRSCRRRRADVPHGEPEAAVPPDRRETRPCPCRGEENGRVRREARAAAPQRKKKGGSTQRTGRKKRRHKRGGQGEGKERGIGLFLWQGGTPKAGRLRPAVVAEPWRRAFSTSTPTQEGRPGTTRPPAEESETELSGAAARSAGRDVPRVRGSDSTSRGPVRNA